MKRGRTIPMKIVLGAAAALLAAVAGFLFFREGETSPPIAVVEEALGAGVSAGDLLFAGQGLETDAKGRAVIRYPDRTRLELASQTRIRGLEVAGGKKLFVVRGRVTADVAPQPAGLPMTVRTAEAEAKVLGTKFVVGAATGSTRLEVEKGLVRLTRLSDRKSADVAAGQVAVAAAGADLVARAVFPPMTPDSWRFVPGTAMSRVAPDPAKFPGIQGRMGPDAVVAAWSGGAFDTKRNRLVLWGGGHTDYYGNEVYAFSVDTLAWERLTEPNPKPSLNNELNADGTPNGRATYNGLAYDAHADRLFAFGGAVAGNGFASCKSTLTLDFDARTWSVRRPAGTVPPPQLGCNASYDPATRKVWWGQNSGLYSYDYAADRWTKHNDDKFYYYTSAVDTKRGLWIVAGNGEVFAYDLRNGNPVRQAWKTAGGDALIKKGNPGLDYDPVRDRITGWAGGAVYTLDPETKAWMAHDSPGAPAPTPNGIYGRWRYVPSVEAFIVVTAAGGDLHFYKPGK